MTPSDLVNPIYRSVVENTFKADHSLDAALFASRLTVDARFQLGGNPAVTGRDAIRQVVTDTFAAFDSVTHTLLKAYELPDVLIYEALVEYRYKDGQVRVLPYANVLDFEGELVRRYRIYIAV